MTRLCVAIFVSDPAQARRDIALAQENGAELLELRIDEFHQPEEIRRLVEWAGVPCIVTCRPTWEGGKSTLRDEWRVDLLRSLGVIDSASFIDIEIETLRRHPGLKPFPHSRKPLPQLILSSHDFTGRPARLTNLVADLNDSPADIAKIVWTARTVRDNCEAFEILRSRRKPTIALCMGEAGLPSRVLAKKFGAFLTFASLDASAGTAPGQVSIADMKRLYRWNAINPATKVFGVVGSPVAHSMSPAIHNAAFDATGFDGVYLPLPVNPGYESFKAFIESWLHCEGLDLAGLSVTIPHKENALRYLLERGGEVDALAARIGAVNTIVIQDGIPRGWSTDYSAILDTITGALGIERGALEGKRVAVLGAGGTGRTAVAALAACGATVVVYNRTRGRADVLAKAFNNTPGKVVAAKWAKLCDSCCQIIVNTTSVGMLPDIDASPMPDAGFSGVELVFDAVYNPPRTKLLQQAAAAGVKTVGGIDMFVRQAAGQFEAWTGTAAPIEVMSDVVRRRLGVGPS